MAQVGEDRLRETLGLLERLGFAYTIEGFADLLLPGIRRLIQCDAAVYNEIAPPPHEGISFSDPPGVMEPIQEKFDRLFAQHPLIAEYMRTGDGSAKRFSDVISQDALHRLDIYREVFAPIRCEYQLATSIATRDLPLIGVALVRAETDFSDRDVELLNLLRPQIARVRRRVKVAMSYRAFETLLEREGRAVVLWSAGGHIEHATLEARELLDRYLGWRAHRDLLPRRLQRWLTESDQPSEITIRNRDRELVVRSLSLGDESFQCLVLEEDTTASSITKLGPLTMRELEVLALVADGRSNEAIASELRITERTVKKHLEQIFRKLGARNRTEAARIYLEEHLDKGLSGT